MSNDQKIIEAIRDWFERVEQSKSGNLFDPLDMMVNLAAEFSVSEQHIYELATQVAPEFKINMGKPKN